jgi:hypothetical protein
MRACRPGLAGEDGGQHFAGAGVLDQAGGFAQRQAGVEHVVDDQGAAADQRALQVGADLATARALALVMIGGQPQGVEATLRPSAPQGPGQVGGEPQAAGQQADRDGVVVDARRDGRPGPATRSAISACEIRTSGARRFGHVMIFGFVMVGRGGFAVSGLMSRGPRVQPLRRARTAGFRAGRAGPDVLGQRPSWVRDLLDRAAFTALAAPARGRSRSPGPWPYDGGSRRVTEK